MLVQGQSNSYQPISPCADQITIVYRVHNGRRQKRRWNLTQGKWVDSYGCGTTSKVVLYEGSVQVSDKACTQVCKIKPGEQVYLDRVGDICISQADICMQKSWTEGLFIFDNVTLRYVMQEIGAWYNTNIVFRSHSLLEERIYFSASRHLPVGEILNVLNDLQIARFIVEGNKIIVSPLS